MGKISTYEDVLNSFHSSFQDKVLIPESLEREWFLKAVGKYSYEIDPLNFDEELLEFDVRLDRYVIDTLGSMMRNIISKENCQK